MSQYSIEDTFHIFLQKAKDLKERELLKSAFNAKLKLSVSFESGEATLLTESPNEELLRSVWITIRYFHSRSEVANLFHVYNLCQEYLTNELHKQCLIKSREMLNSKINQSQVMDITINDVKCTPLFIFNTFTNAVFHHDKRCVEFLNGMDALMIGMLRQEFVGFIMDSIDAIRYLAQIIQYALDNKEIKGMQK